jgi:chemotaxis-related protein WspB
MLYIVFHVGDYRYAIDAARVVEVLPIVHWKRVPGVSPEVAGVLNYHGTPIPLMDLSKLIANRASRRWMSTRIIVVDRSTVQGDGTMFLGLLAEQVTETMRQSEGDFQPPGLGSGRAAYLGNVVMHAKNMIQRIEVLDLPFTDVRNQPAMQGSRPA